MNAIILLNGVSVASFAFAGLYFFKFWRAGRDPLFLCFAVGCWFLSLERIFASSLKGALSEIRTPATDAASWIYVLRLMAFVAILIAVIVKNRASKQ